MTTARRFPFAVEVKRREGWSWRELLAGRRSPVWGWWDQACKQADEAHADPMLWFRHNREEWTVMMGPWIRTASPKAFRVKMPTFKIFHSVVESRAALLHEASVVLDQSPEIFARPSWA